MAEDKHKILIVDDEAKILAVARKILAGERYELFTASEVDEAMAILDEKGPIAVVLSDNRMPAMRGTEFFKKIKVLFPDTVRVLMTAHFDSQLIEDVVNTGEAYRYLKKPLDFNLVKQVIEAGIERYESSLKEHADAKSLENYGVENGKLLEESEYLKKKVAGLARRSKILLGTLALVVALFAVLQVHPLWGERHSPVSSVSIEGWQKLTNGTAIDSRSGLTWMTQDFLAIEGRAPENWSEAMVWAEKMNRKKYGGHSDWRVPTIAEYQATFDGNSGRLAFDLDPERQVAYPRPFEDGGGYGYWSGEEVGSTSARYFFFVGGYSKTEKKDYVHSSISIRLVRG